jgi:prolyl-tRNA synthetase
MRVSKLFSKTSKTAPADEVAKNAQLLIRAGYVHKEMAGVYAYLPLGLRVLENIKQIVREEMNALDSQELIMTGLQRKEIWETTGRWDDEVVDVWFKSKLKDGTDVGFGWSHEEPIVEMLKHYLESYKDLPMSVYQFQTKLRNELRAKSGIMRGREFVMKDMYSCSTDAEQHEQFYQACIEAYKRVFDRLGIGESTFVTYASGGAFTQFSHEFQTICDAGEDIIVKTSDGAWQNLEIAPSKIPVSNVQDAAKDYEERELKDIIGVQALLEALEIPIEKSTKTLIYTADSGEIIFAVVRSDYDVNEVKLATVADLSGLKFASEEAIRELTGAEIGYAGVVNLPENVRVFYDDSVEGMTNFETGANKTHYHAVNVNFGRDVKLPERFHDFKEAKAGDLDPATDEPLEFAKTAEVGNIFNFGTQKSEAMDFTVTNEKGERQFVHLGSYGIGITRVMGVIAEKFSDEKGLVWPDNVAPYRVYLAQLGTDERVVRTAEKLYDSLQDIGVTVLYDDRNARPGEKFADADLLGIPHRVVVSERTVDQSVFEYKKRTETDSLAVDLEKLKSILTA